MISYRLLITVTAISCLMICANSYQNFYITPAVAETAPAVPDWAQEQPADQTPKMQTGDDKGGDADLLAKAIHLAEQGNPKGEAMLGMAYQDGDFGLPKNAAVSMNWYRKAADQREPLSEWRVGVSYLNGEMGEKDETKAAKLIRDAAEQGFAQGEAVYGSLCAEGIGVPKDIAEAIRWYQKAVEQGDARGQILLGLAYINGQGVQKDPSEAVKWVRKSADQGFNLAEYTLATMYQSGKGGQKNEGEALKWFRKAAEHGYAEAQRIVGGYYFTGKEVPKDYAEGIKWFRKAAEQGDKKGQTALAGAYYQGKGVPKDYVVSYMWLNLAAAQGDEDARKVLDIITKDMTQNQISEAQHLTSEFHAVPVAEDHSILKAALEDSFSPHQGATALIVKVIGEAQKTIRVAAYTFTSSPIADALIKAHQRGVDVRVVLDERQENGRGNLAGILKANNIPIRANGRYAIMHDKFIVIDNKAVELGSFNYTKAAEERNAENALVVRDSPQVVADYTQQWEKLWEEATVE
ncbi:MAG: phospholipase D-like domain-containing protein [Alphaproteobacteria bacterium]|nr:phospholipase D-like domain-containing protein [Alphaproteobacteria bacterium]